MTDKEINRAVAESAGWELVPLDGRVVAGYLVMTWKRPDGEKGFPLPDYCNDLNVMHEAEKTLTREQVVDYCAFTLRRTTGEGNASDCKMIMATAHQRAEAYLRTIGKWRDA